MVGSVVEGVCLGRAVQGDSAQEEEVVGRSFEAPAADWGNAGTGRTMVLVDIRAVESSGTACPSAGLAFDLGYWEAWTKKKCPYYLLLQFQPGHFSAYWSLLGGWMRFAGEVVDSGA